MSKRFSSQLTKLEEGYNSAQTKATEILNSSIYTQEHKTETFKSEFTANAAKYIAEVKQLRQEAISSLKSLNEVKAKKLFPLLTSDNNKVAGEMQRAEAKQLLASKNYSMILDELKSNADLNRIDFVNTIIEGLQSIIPGKDTILSEADAANKPLFDEITSLKNEFYKKNGLESVIEDSKDADNSIDKAQRFLFVIKDQENTLQFNNVYLPDKESSDFQDSIIYSQQMQNVTDKQELPGYNSL